MRPTGFEALDLHDALRALQAAAVEQGGGRTALHVAAEFGHADAARMLIAHGMSLEARDARGETALHVAARRGHAGLVRLLVAAGADPGARDVDGRTPARAAEAGGHAAVAAIFAATLRRAANRPWWRRWWPG